MRAIGPVKTTRAWREVRLDGMRRLRSAGGYEIQCPTANLNKKSEETANGPRHLPSAASYTCRKQRSHRHGKLEPENEASEVP